MQGSGRGEACWVLTVCPAPCQHSPAAALADPGVVYAVQLSQAHRAGQCQNSSAAAPAAELLDFHLVYLVLFVLHLQVFYC